MGILMDRRNFLLSAACLPLVASIDKLECDKDLGVDLDPIIGDEYHAMTPDEIRRIPGSETSGPDPGEPWIDLRSGGVLIGKCRRPEIEIQISDIDGETVRLEMELDEPAREFVQQRLDAKYENHFCQDFQFETDQFVFWECVCIGKPNGRFLFACLEDESREDGHSIQSVYGVPSDRKVVVKFERSVESLTLDTQTAINLGEALIALAREHGAACEPT